jgi:hypothetical protein
MNTLKFGDIISNPAYIALNYVIMLTGLSRLCGFLWANVDQESFDLYIDYCEEQMEKP